MSITIQVHDGQGGARERVLEAETIGAWAVHPSTMYDGGVLGYTVTFVATGVAYCVGCDLAQARETAKALGDVPDANAIETRPEGVLWPHDHWLDLMAINDRMGLLFDAETNHVYGSEAQKD